MNEPSNTLSFDPNAVLNRVEGDLELLKEIAVLFFEEAPRLLRDVENAITTGDSKALEHAAHTLKGSVGNFGALAAFEAAFGLERMGRNNDFARAREVFTRLEQQVSLLIPALEALTKDKAA